MAVGRERRVIRRRRLRVDTTIFHYLTDVSLLADSVRVLTRTINQLGQRARERTRSVGCVFETAQGSRTAGSRASPAASGQSRTKIKAPYQGLCGFPTRRSAKRTQR